MQNIETLMRRKYKIALWELSEDYGGGWFAEIPALRGCCSDVDTPEEALRNLEEAKRAWLETALELGRRIPEPDVLD